VRYVVSRGSKHSGANVELALKVPPGSFPSFQAMRVIRAARCRCIMRFQTIDDGIGIVVVAEIDGADRHFGVVIDRLVLLQMTCLYTEADPESSKPSNRLSSRCKKTSDRRSLLAIMWCIMAYVSS